MTLSLTENLAGYVPLLMRRRFAQGQALSDMPEREQLRTAVLFADISGFTALAERLGQRGPDGVEELTSLLNAYFGVLIDQIQAHGGDVVKFAGDALLAIWPVAGEPDAEGVVPAPAGELDGADGPAASPRSGRSGEAAAETARRREGAGLVEATLRAAQCALAIQAELQGFAPALEERLALSIGIGAGELLVLHLGGGYTRSEFVLHGDALANSALAEQDAEPGQVVLGLAAWQLVSRQAGAERLPSGNALLLRLETGLPPRPSPLPALPDEAEQSLRAYIPGAVLARLAAGQTDWLAELRPVTVLFVQLPDLLTAYAGSAQQAMRELQAVLYRYEGSVNKLSVDDKGVSLVAAFGLPPLAHEDDPLRGTLAALAIQSSLRSLGLRGAIGVTTGKAFCGLVGNQLRREYTLIGDVVNLAARLMQAAAALGGPEEPPVLLIDTPTYEGAAERVECQGLAPLTLKGKGEPVPVFRPQKEKRRALRAQSAIVGRAAERAQLAESLRALQEEHASGIILIEGEAGIGKSRLADDLRRLAQQRKLSVFLGAGDAVEKTTSYFAWRQVFSQMFDMDNLVDPQAQRAHVLDLLSDEPEWLRLAPLLAPVFPFDLPDNELTAQMTGQLRADNTRDLLIALLQESVRRSPKLLILEDAHWLDSGSWELLQAVSAQVRPLLLVLVTRPIGEPVPSEYLKLLQLEQTRRQSLAPLSADEALALVRQRLGVDSLPESVSAFILERADGHPFFTEELAYALRDSGVLRIANRDCRLAPNVELSRVSFPDTIQGVIISRIDKLPPTEQLTLKVASVIGRIFSMQLLRDIYPIEGDKSSLLSYMGVLERMSFTLQETPEPDLAYIFKHITIQEVAYNLMLFAQRRDLHRTVAEWYERTYAGDLELLYPVLAYHWGKAEDQARTLAYLERAGEAALRSGAFQEAIGFFKAALGLLDAVTPDERELIRRARWHRQMGDAYYGLGLLAESREQVSQALAVLGAPILVSRGRLIRKFAGQVARQAWQLLRPPRVLEAHDPRRERLLEQARAYSLLGEICYFANEVLLALTCAVSSLNQAELLGPSPELARNYVTATIAACNIPLYRLAERYATRAQASAAQIDQLSTRAYVFNLIGIYAVGAGQWERAAEMFKTAANVSQELGDRRQWIMSHSTVAVYYHYRGSFEQAAESNTLVYTNAMRSKNQIQQGWGFYSKAENLIRLGRFAEALQLIEQAEVLVATDIKRTAQVRVYMARAMIHWRTGQPELARQAADRAATVVTPRTANVYSGMEAYGGMAEVYLGLWERARGGSEEAAMLQSARRSMKILGNYARLHPVGQPRLALWQGRFEQLLGKQQRARKRWLRGLEAARSLNMPYEQALLHDALGRFAGEAEHARAAERMFAELGAGYDLDVLRQAVPGLAETLG